MTRFMLFAVLSAGVAGVWLIQGTRSVARNDEEQHTGELRQEEGFGEETLLLKREVKERIYSMPTLLEECVDAVGAQAALDEMHAYLQGLPSDIAAGVVAKVLRDGVLDAPTQIAFDVGKGGRLDGHSTLRVALLDWLLEFDVELAGIVSRELLETPTHPDEWALALRNVARAEPTEDQYPYLREKTEELIRNANWNRTPSIGFFESFDVLVHIRATESAPLLSELVADRTPEGKALAHAAFLTLDRLTLREPVGMMKRLSGDEELTMARGAMVANMMARADLQNLEQRQLVRNYLLNSNRSVEELKAFAGVFPNANYSISPNLLTTTDTPKGGALRVHDKAALEVVNRWLSDPEFESIRPHVEAMQKRLAVFVGR